MKYAIIAAGNGSRLAKEGVTAPKPLVKVNGEQLIDRLVRVFCNNNATEIVVICNEEMTRCAGASCPYSTARTGWKGRSVALCGEIDTQLYAQLCGTEPMAYRRTVCADNGRHHLP